MTRLDYELIDMDMPELKLPDWEDLDDAARALVQRHNQAQLIAARAIVLLRADHINSRGLPIYTKT